ncbi:MAG: CoA-binding protein, partial [Microthrixaceae bacterium]
MSVPHLNPEQAKSHFSALFEPRGIVIAGASTHPGKFGFVSLHNVIASGYQGKIFATNREGVEVLGVTTMRSLEELPPGEVDLIFVYTPKSANLDLLREAADKGISAAFLTSAGYGESGSQGRADEAELVELCEELGILLVGPNGQGVVSTPAKLCAQIV